MVEGSTTNEIPTPQIRFKPIEISDAQLLVHLRKRAQPDSGGKNKNGENIDDMVHKLVTVKESFSEGYPQSFIQYYNGAPVGYMLFEPHTKEDHIVIADMGIIESQRNNPEIVISMMKHTLSSKRNEKQLTFIAWAKEDTSYRVLALKGIRNRLHDETGYDVIDLKQNKDLGDKKKPDPHHLISLRPVSKDLH